MNDVSVAPGYVFDFTSDHAFTGLSCAFVDVNDGTSFSFLLDDVPDAVPEYVLDFTDGQALTDLLCALVAIVDSTSSSSLDDGLVFTAGQALTDLLCAFIDIVDVNFAMSANVRVCSRELSISCLAVISSNALKGGLLAILDVADSEGGSVYSLYSNTINYFCVFLFFFFLRTI